MLRRRLSANVSVERVMACRASNSLSPSPTTHVLWERFGSRRAAMILTGGGAYAEAGHRNRCEMLIPMSCCIRIIGFWQAFIKVGPAVCLRSADRLDGYPRFRCWCDPKGLVDPCEIVTHEIKLNRALMIFDLFLLKAFV
jgi:hypothetical protein